MALTDANFAANLKTARTITAARLGVDPSNLTYDQRTVYNKALAAYITLYPNSFSPTALEVARRIVQQPGYQAQTDTSLDLGAFVDDAIANADAINPLSVANIGTTGKWLLGAGVLVLVIYLIFKASIARHNLRDD